MGDIADSHLEQIDWYGGRPNTKPSGPGPCPRCGAPTKLKEGPHGPFHGCTNFPDCRGNRNPTISEIRLYKIRKEQEK